MEQVGKGQEEEGERPATTTTTTTTTSPPFVMDTIGSCFMCLKVFFGVEGPGPSISSSSTSSRAFSLFSKVLQLDFAQVFEEHSASFKVVSISSTADEGDDGGVQDQEEGEVQQVDDNIAVPLCGECSAEIDNFSALANQLTLCVRKIEGLMVTANGDGRLGEYRQRAKKKQEAKKSYEEEEELVGVNIVDSMRAEVVTKCLDWTNRTTSTIPPMPIIRDPQKRGNNVFNNKSPAASHASTDESVGVYLCESCGESFSYLGALKAHVVTNHRDRHTTVASNTPSENPPIAGPSTSGTTPQERGRRGGGIQGEGGGIDILPTEKLGGTQDIINSVEFTTLKNGHRRCTLCSKLVRKTLMAAHAEIHIGTKWYKCESCPPQQEELLFRSEGGLKRHRVANHRHTLFSHFKYPRVDSAPFNRMVEQVFLELADDPAKNVANGLFTCSLCPGASNNKLLCYYSQKVNLDSHLIEYHMDNLVSRLMVLQEEELNKKKGVVVQAGGGGGGPSEEDAEQEEQGFAKKAKRSRSTSSTPPPPPIIPCSPPASPGPTEMVVKFTFVSAQEMQCQLCSKILPAAPVDIGLHAKSHGGGVNIQQQCPNCPMSFLDAGNLRRHTLLSHRHAFLSHLRDPRVPPEVFAQLVGELMDGSRFLRNPDQGYQCCFCEVAVYKRKAADLFGHLIHDHMGQVQSSLASLQENALELEYLRGIERNLFVVAPPVVPLLSTATTSPPANTTQPAPGGGDEVPPAPLPQLTCPHCGEIFSSRSNSELETHLMTLHSQEVMCLCELCSHTFPDNYHLRNHFFREHSANLLSPFRDARLTEQGFMDCATTILNRRLRKEDEDAATAAVLEVGGGTGVGVGVVLVTCDFCQNGFRSVEDAASHLLYTHMGEIGGELVMVQNEIIDFHRGQHQHYQGQDGH